MQRSFLNGEQKIIRRREMALFRIIAIFFSSLSEDPKHILSLKKEMFWSLVSKTVFEGC
ncbi:hypothetical protein Q667_15925 [Marinobacter sp. C1S70]|nr:hypothetical protein Q667_15925 [Marinobacter sp. C1S70]